MEIVGLAVSRKTSPDLTGPTRMTEVTGPRPAPLHHVLWVIGGERWLLIVPQARRRALRLVIRVNGNDIIYE